MEKILMGSIVGFAFLTLASYIFVLLKLPFLILPTTLFLILKTKWPKIKFDKKYLVTIIVFLIGILGQLAIISPSGTKIDGDLVFWSANGHDGTWHIALMNEIKKGYPFQNPIMSGEKLVNYHFFSDVLPAMVSKYTGINDFVLYFKIFPVIYSLFLGSSVYFLTKRLTKSHSAAVWATIFTYFTGSFGYLIGKGESIFWATQPQSASGNPPQIISDFLILTAVYYLIKYTEKPKNKLNFWTCVLLFGTISAFKIYAGVVLLFAVGILAIYRLFKDKDVKLILITVISAVLAAFLYIPNATSGANFLIFEPLWYIRTMIVEPSRLNWLDWELKRQTYIYEHNLKRVIWLEGIGFLIFFFGNLGIRFLGLWEVLRKNKNQIYITIYSIIFISIVFPLLFLQKGVATNTAQFLQYFILFFGILAGITTSNLLGKIKSTKLQALIAILLIFAMIPTQVTLLKDFYGSPTNPRPAFAKITSSEIEALKFIKENSDKNSVIITPPYNQYLDLKDKVPNIWDWFDTSYVAALSDRLTYMDDYEQLDIMGYNYKSRLDIKKTIFESNNTEEVKKAIYHTKANILYIPKPLKPKVNLTDLGIVKIFENESTMVFQGLQ